MPLGKEDVDRIAVTHGNFKILCAVGKLNRRSFSIMHAPEINRQMPIDEYEDVVVSRKSEYLVALVSEVGAGC